MGKKPIKHQGQKTFRPPVNKPAPTSNNPRAGVFNLRTVVFFIVLIISLVIYLKNLSGLPELTNEYIKRQAGWVISLQAFIAILAYLMLAYFGFLHITQKTKEKITTIFMAAGVLLIIVLHWFAFNAGFEDVDDNASYMIAAKSLVEHGAPYYLYLPDSPPDTEGALGLPVMLIPLFLIWGMNFQPMEILIFLTMIGSVVMCYLLFRKVAGKTFALIITLLFGTHPYIVAFSSIIMTEIPYLFWSILGLAILLKFEGKEKFHVWWMLFAVFAVFMTYLTRAVGVGMFAAAGLYFLLKSNLWFYIKNRSVQFFRDSRFIKFFAISALLFAVMIGYQAWTSSLGGVSQAESLQKMNYAQNFSLNAANLWKVLPQSIFSGSIIRWEVKEIEPVNLLWGLVFIFTAAGFLISLFKRNLIALYTLFVMLALMLGNNQDSPIVLSRYLIIFTPFLIYFLYMGIQWPLDKLIRQSNWGTTAATSVLALILASSFTGNGYTIQKLHAGQLYPAPYASFLECATWAKDNLEKDAIVASRKERIFYVFSDGLQGYKHFSGKDQVVLKDVKTEEAFKQYQQDKLQEFKDRNTRYLIIDTFSSSSVNIILPIIQANPDKFKLVKIIGDEQKGPCYIFEMLPW
jgi:hypothetical protein